MDETGAAGRNSLRVYRPEIENWIFIRVFVRLCMSICVYVCLFVDLCLCPFGSP